MNDIDKMPSKCQGCTYWEVCEYPYICDDIKPKQAENDNINAVFAGNPQDRPTDCDLISRQAAIDLLKQMRKDGDMVPWEGKNVFARIRKLPSAQPDVPDTNVGDMISRQAAIDALHMHLMYRMGTDSNKKRLDEWINNLPSVQPERTCVNCGRTVNNGGWYADGRTRCPIEEHYALPKDGFCHLWEKRNVTDDDYPERRTDERTDSETGGD